ncbi:hypothetical protein PVAP13_4NG249522 [Panicum virgatum]|uniref:Uncharacterized protein n=1 Tax=Panicum virgatum TaxID=38727 RepID=A0A8T0T923_PANVG|nr:hypothetical protein PVAP13_4NG249522 [Panicum virgatum]
MGQLPHPAAWGAPPLPATRKVTSTPPPLDAKRSPRFWCRFDGGTTTNGNGNRFKEDDDCQDPSSTRRRRHRRRPPQCGPWGPTPQRHPAGSGCCPCPLARPPPRDRRSSPCGPSAEEAAGRPPCRRLCSLCPGPATPANAGGGGGGMSDTNIGMLAGLNAYNRDGSEDQQQHQHPEGAPAAGALGRGRPAQGRAQCNSRVFK